jgi:hypothetical protein
MTIEFSFVFERRNFFHGDTCVCISDAEALRGTELDTNIDYVAICNGHIVRGADVGLLEFMTIPVT